MRVLSYVYDSASMPDHVESVLDRLDEYEESGQHAPVERVDVAAAANRADGRREAMLTVKNAVRIGSTPSELFDEDGNPDLSAGALITEAETGRRSLHIGRDALDALDSS